MVGSCSFPLGLIGLINARVTRVSKFSLQLHIFEVILTQEKISLDMFIVHMNISFLMKMSFYAKNVNNSVHLPDAVSVFLKLFTLQCFVRISAND